MRALPSAAIGLALLQCALAQDFPFIPMRGLLVGAAEVPAAEAARKCLPFPAAPSKELLESLPYGSSIISTKCDVVERKDTAPGWVTFRYRWTSGFAPDDAAQFSAARNTVTEDEVVLLTVARSGRLRPVWHARYQSDYRGVFRSVTPELVVKRSTTLLSVQSCINGTGGCMQEFIQRGADGRWRPLKQLWLQQLPAGLAQRIRKGARIEPGTLKSEVGLYRERDPNCCPSDMLHVDLAIRGDALVLVRHAVAPSP